ncbi:Polyprenol reductase 1 [Hibiscus syriacus]|uniref:Polyprenol reductase 1 n=1 Tax=Hibiscus syriacus TaxID=106335 RepID=A0A6A3AQZ6_HIBSY|nr:Polyprenol reductase 1 [Hibiscus syriacus]
MNLLGILMETFASLSISTVKTGLIWLLRAAWIAGILPVFIASLPTPRLNFFHSILLGFAKRARLCHLHPISTEFLSALLFVGCGLDNNLVNGFYTAAPLSLCTFCALEAFNFAADQVAEFKVEGQEMVSILDLDLWGYVKPITRLVSCQWAGAAIYAWGWFHEFRCHEILGSLRERGDQTAEYGIPHGDWFEIVSSPHYLAEMVIYAGLLVASGGTDFTIWLLLGFVVANLSFVAVETHRWYLQKFEDYPHNRWAIIPFVY